jgi:hypothetical protein
MTKLPGQDRTATRGQVGKDSQYVTARKGQPEKENWKKLVSDSFYCNVDVRRLKLFFLY